MYFSKKLLGWRPSLGPIGFQVSSDRSGGYPSLPTSSRPKNSPKDHPHRPETLHLAVFQKAGVGGIGSSWAGDPFVPISDWFRIGPPALRHVAGSSSVRGVLLVRIRWVVLCVPFQRLFPNRSQQAERCPRYSATKVDCSKKDARRGLCLRDRVKSSKTCKTIITVPEALHSFDHGLVSSLNSEVSVP